MLENKTTLQFMSYETAGDHIEYKIVIKNSRNQKFELQERYRVLREIYTQIKANKNLDDIPSFPPKRLFGNMNISFVSQRKRELETFFNKLLEKYSLDELKPLKAFLTEKTQSIIAEPEPIKTEPPKPIVPVVNVAPKKTSAAIIAYYGSMFFDLNDRSYFNDDYFPHKRRYKINMEIDSDFCQLPIGDESNLVSVQERSLVSLRPKIPKMLAETTDKIRKQIQSIKFENIDNIIVQLD